MSSPTTFERLRAVIVNALGVDEDQVLLASNYVNDLNCDSLDLAELQFQTEQAFSVDIPDAVAEQQHTVQATVTYLDKVLGK